MNVFVVDTNPVIAAQMLCDKHVIKQTLETAQILSTIAGGPYKPTHQKHPCVLWAGQNRTNFNWLCKHGMALAHEYTRRYGKRHKSQDVIERIAWGFDAERLPVGISEFVQCMPDQYRDSDPVRAYRKYYHSKAEFATWKTKPPYWWMDKEYLNA